MLKRFWALAFISSLLFNTSCTKDDLDKFLDTGLSDSEIAEGLKEALKVGTDTSTSQLSKIDGYLKDQAVKILLPAEIRARIEEFKAASIDLGFTTVTGAQVYNQGFTNSALGINIAPLKDKEDELVVGINRAAESAASIAGPIFIDAITGITIADARDILFGSDTAATFYLRQRTYTSLFDEYEPKIDAALQSVKIGNTSVVDSYENYVSDYNNIINTSIPGFGTIGSIAGLKAIAASDLSAYSTGKGLDGLFLKISEEEADIRKDPLARVNDILQKVFGELD